MKIHFELMILKAIFNFIKQVLFFKITFDYFKKLLLFLQELLLMIITPTNIYFWIYSIHHAVFYAGNNKAATINYQTLTLIIVAGRI